MNRILVNLVISIFCALCVLGPTDLYAKNKKKLPPRRHHRHSEAVKPSSQPKAKKPAREEDDDSRSLLTVKKVKPHRPLPPPPPVTIDTRIDSKLVKAAKWAWNHAFKHSKSRCWHYVKDALLATGAVNSRPKTYLAKEAGDELVRDFGFTRLPTRDPSKAPLGAVLVYSRVVGKKTYPGHVELRAPDGCVSDFRSRDAISKRLAKRGYRFIAAFALFSSHQHGHK